MAARTVVVADFTKDCEFTSGRIETNAQWKVAAIERQFTLRRAVFGFRPNLSGG
jgi:hypothetical protein